MQGRRTLRNVGYQIHARLESQADGRNYDTFKHVAVRIREDAADKPGTRNAREAHTLVARHVHLAYRIRLVRGIGFLQCGLAAHDLPFTQPAARGLLDGIQRQYRRIRNRRHFVFRIATVAGILLVIKVVIDTLAPEERLIHHPVTLAPVKLRHSAVVHIFRIGIEVRAFVMQGEVGHLPVRVVHIHRLARYRLFPARRHLRNLGQYAVALLHDGIHMPAHFIRIAELVSGPVIQV